MNFFARIAIILICLCIAVASALAFRQEYAVVYQLRGTTNDQIDTLTLPDHRPAVPASARTLRDLLTNCARLMLQAPRLKAEPTLADLVRAQCAGVAEAALVRAPANARAHALSVLMARPLLPGPLSVAQRTAPYEPWPLVTRLAAIAAADSDDPALEGLAREDVARALESSWGRRELAGLYLDHPDMRPLVQAALSTRPAAEQSDFLRLARQAGEKLR